MRVHVLLKSISISISGMQTKNNKLKIQTHVANKTDADEYEQLRVRWKIP